MNLLLMGPQGCGKGTQSERISKDFGLVQISTGVLFRQSIENGEKLGLEAQKYMNQGVLVPLDLTVKILAERLKKPDCKNGVILDGFPRSLEQAEALSKILKVDYVILFDTPREECIERLLSRRFCKDCKTNFSTRTYHKDTCDRCGGKLLTRDDDNLEAIKTRLEVYDKTTTPLINFYADRLFKVKAVGAPEEIYSQVKNFLKGKMK